MKVHFFIAALMLGLAFMTSGQGQSVSRKTQHIEVSRIQDLDTLHLNFCDTFCIEVHGLYPIQLELPPAETDYCKVKALLLKNGFRQTDWGGGDWDKGPRIMNSKYAKGNCNCEVDKVYYYNKKRKDGNYDLRVSERLFCNGEFAWDE